MHEDLRSWREGGSWFVHRGHSIYYREAGAGETLLLLHGFPTSSWDWHRIWEPLSGRFHLIAPDFIGFGFSAKPRHYEYSIHDQASLVEGLLDERGINRVRILSHDYGVTVAQELLARNESRASALEEGFEIAAVCFLNGGLFPESTRPRLIQRLLLTPAGPLLGRLYRKDQLARILQKIFGPDTGPSDEMMSCFWELITYNKGKRIAHRLIRFIPERAQHRSRWVGALQRTRIPLGLVVGTADPVSGINLVERYRQLVPEPRIVELDRVGHYPQLEAPEACLSACLPLLIED